MNTTQDVMRRLKDMIVMGQGSKSETASLLIDSLSEIERLQGTTDTFIHVIENCMNEIERLRVLVDSMGKALEGMSCHNCDDRKCMDCVFRSQHDKCYDDCYVCTPQDSVRDSFTDRYVERERVLKLWELYKEAPRELR